jgi:hypothetical protein
LQISHDVGGIDDPKPTEFDGIVFVVVFITGLLLLGVTINRIGCDKLNGYKPNLT